MDARVGDQVGLELGDVDVQGAVETERGGQRGDGLGQQAVQVGVGGALDVEVATADVIKSLVVDLVGDIGVLKQTVNACFVFENRIEMIETADNNFAKQIPTLIVNNRH